ncbi:hypothetical protein BASA50_004079 [Batrachochytrium salamandrivorans]|uniref:Peptidase M16 N-terminal domain-containing protein n=1 Tax=Batrachochytrium salamandrivorans TaxID=1357716 RepID=A0ABQ8FGY7_9FUNG|nr:hypothetical protein BASA50_004079 [Batrachochytrium salamandrivorans]KAJ1343824.1 hypothetical protein BSLG_001635 [Batrachochytrium salamandrivorans]
MRNDTDSPSGTSDRVFSLESTERFRLPSGISRIKVYKLSHSGFRVVFAEVPGPLCSASVIFPTLCKDHKGLSHTLEHLIFCGSKTIPHRGFLDFLAIRCLSTGTNAYTSEDHTSYEITTAGSDGMIEILPIFLDHILNPTLRERQFTTEVYHLNHEAKHQGVVYCEMASRENGEQDLLDLNIRQLLYQNETTYSFECGGLTKEIAQLTNAEVIDYHSEFYRLENTTIVITGKISPSALFTKLLEHPEIFPKKPLSTRDHLYPTIQSPQLSGGPGSLISRRIPFASADTEVGSIGYGWRGPPSEDVATIIALDVLFRFLHENGASLLAQAFVERADPYASSVDFDIKGYIDTSLVLYFSGVPYFPDGDIEMCSKDKSEEEHLEEDDEEEEDDDEEDDEEEDEDDDEEDDDDDDEEEEEGGERSSHTTTERMRLFQPSVYFGLVRDALQGFITHGFTEPGGMLSTIKRHRRKALEILEEEPHDAITNFLIPDIIRHYFAPSSSLNDTRAQGGSFKLATRAKIFDILDDLEKENDVFWKKLTEKWLLQAPACEVIMIPSPELSTEQQKSEQQGIHDRVKALGKEGLKKLKIEEDLALEENKVNIVGELLSLFPPIPDASKAPSLRSSMQNVSLESHGDSRLPFMECQVVRTETAFVSVRLGLNIGQIASDLRPYFVIFQELLFQTPLILPATLGSKTITMDYKEVMRYASHVFVSHEAAIGFGNEVWSTSWLSQVFMVSAGAEGADWERMIRFLSQALLFADFTKDRIATVAKNLLSSITETKRDGGSVLSAVTTRIYSRLSKEPQHSSSKSSKSNNALGKETAELPEATSSNDAAISIFTQERFLRRVIKLCKDGKSSLVTDKLNRLRSAMLLSDNPKAPTFIQIAVPMDFSLSDGNKTSSNIDYISDFLCIWGAEFSKYKMRQPPMSKKRRLSVDMIPESLSPTSFTSPFPFPRVPFTDAHLDSMLGRGLMVSVSGLSTSYFSQFVACDVFAPHPHSDYFATVLLAELLSRSEGPLYNAVRGPGFAYGVSLNVCLWIGQLSLDLYDASEPYKSVIAFYRILENLKTKTGFQEICSQFNIETARASVAYRWVAEGSSPDSVVRTALRSSLRGFESLDQHRKYIEHLYTVTTADLEHVFKKYYLRFLDASQRVTILVTVPGKSATSLQSLFGGVPGLEERTGLDTTALSAYKIPLKQVSLNDLQFDV